MTEDTPLLSPEGLRRVRTLLTAADLDGWLLYDFGHQNLIAHSLLGLGETTRRAFVLVPRVGDPVVLRHAIEASAWRHVPWKQRAYSGWQGLERELSALLGGLGTLAMEHSPRGAVPSVDRVPAGVVELVEACGGRVGSSMDLVSVLHSRWTSRGLELHRAAGEVVRRVALAAYERAARAVREDAPVREADLMDWITSHLCDGGLTEGTACIVAGGPRSSDPHYSPEGSGAHLGRGDVVLIDLWGRHPGPGIFADQTWMGVLDNQVPERVQSVWVGVREARDRALEFLTERGAARTAVRGYEVDAVARGVLAEHGLETHFTHRLGHSIDRYLHGSGPDLDDLETHDERVLVEGVGFSVEPGVYLPDEFGVRSEVNVHWGPAEPEVTPGSIQQRLLRLPSP